MSGYAGVVNLDGAPVETRILERLNAALLDRGPDASSLHVEGNTGFSYAFLQTTPSPELPFVTESNICAIGHVRLDDRLSLMERLRSTGEDILPGSSALALVLRSYLRWGQHCVDHLLGDFSFAIWDHRRQSLFCARDHFGVRPLFYAKVGPSVVFSNTLSSVLQHPAISKQPNPEAIGDFLLFGSNGNPATTFYRDVQRLPAAHTGYWDSEAYSIRRYWSLPVEDPIHYRRPDDYPERFRELLTTALCDRIRTSRVGVFMSGGIDSPTLAATAKGELDAEVTAFTTVYDGIDHERYYAGTVARHLRIPIIFRDGNAECVDTCWERSSIVTDEPAENPFFLTSDVSHHRQVAEKNRLMLFGEGPDTALCYEWQPYLRHLSLKRQFGRIAAESARHFIRHRRVPLLSTLPRMFRERNRGAFCSNGYPSWLEPNFETRFKLRDRWKEEVAPVHPIRPRAHSHFTGANWQNLFESLDAGVLRSPLEVVHPFFDLRLLRFMLAVPAIPWCREKHLIRAAMRGFLPPETLARPKTALDPNPWLEATKRSGFQKFNPVQVLQSYVQLEKVREVTPETLGDFREAIRVRALNYWLKNSCS